MEADRGYLAVLAERPIRRLLLSSLTGRVAFSMLPLGLILFATGETGSAETAGALVAAFSLTSALAPARGRVVDRDGPRALIAFAVACAAGLAALAAAGTGHAPAAVLVALGALAGALVPPLGPFTRAVWGIALREREAQRRRVFALDSAGEEAALIVAPLVVALIVAAGSSAGALLVAAAGLLGGTIASGRSTLARTPLPRSRPAARGGDGRLPVTLWLVIGSLAGPGAALGAVNVAVVALARAQGAPARAGLVLAALAVGTAAASLLTGRRRPPGAARRRLALLELALAAALAAAALSADHPAALAAALVLAGAAVGALFVTLYLLVGELMPPDAGTRAFAWLVTANNGGLALGAAAAGALAVQDGGGAGLWLASGFALAGMTVAFAAGIRS